MKKSTHNSSFSFSNILITFILSYLLPTNLKECTAYRLVSHAWQSILTSDAIWKKFIDLEMLPIEYQENLFKLFFKQPQFRRYPYLNCDYEGRYHIYHATICFLNGLRLNDKQKTILYSEHVPLSHFTELGILSFNRLEALTYLQLNLLSRIASLCLQISCEEIKDDNNTQPPFDPYLIADLPNKIQKLGELKEKFKDYTSCSELPERAEIESLINSKLSWFQQYQQRPHPEFKSLPLIPYTPIVKSDSACCCLIC